MGKGGAGAVAVVENRRFLGVRAESEEVLAGLGPESRAALRQFSFERLIGYGVEFSDAVELRARVLDGQGWREAAGELASACRERAEAVPGGPTCAAYLRRASALTRMSQVMMLADTDERRAVYAHAVDLYARAARISGGREHFTVETGVGVLTGWRVDAGPDAVGAAVVVGGVEGWAMDFDAMGTALAERGIEAFLLDAPGQGESRMANGVYLGDGWLDAYRAVLDAVEAWMPGQPIGVVGNSMGGSFAMALAAADTRIAACVDNGGIVAPGAVPPEVGTFFTKMAAFCDRRDADEVRAVWADVDPAADGPNAGYPLLVLHGGLDPLVSDEMVQAVLERVPAGECELVVFSDGNHCVYNHREDRDLLVADWMRARLAARGEK